MGGCFDLLSAARLRANLVDVGVCATGNVYVATPVTVLRAIIIHELKHGFVILKC